MERTTEAQAIAELANPVQDLVRGDLVAVNNEYKIEDLERFQEGRNRSRGVLNTPAFEDFKTYVLDFALNQINELTDITAKYEQHKKGRTISGFSFTFRQKKDTSKKVITNENSLH